MDAIRETLLGQRGDWCSCPGYRMFSTIRAGDHQCACYCYCPQIPHSPTTGRGRHTNSMRKMALSKVLRLPFPVGGSVRLLASFMGTGVQPWHIGFVSPPHSPLVLRGSTGQVRRFNVVLPTGHWARFISSSALLTVAASFAGAIPWLAFIDTSLLTDNPHPPNVE